MEKKIFLPFERLKFDSFFFILSADWSILYVVIGVFIMFIMISAVCFALTRYCRTTKPRTRAKTQKYALLESQDNEVPARKSNHEVCQL